MDNEHLADVINKLQKAVSHLQNIESHLSDADEDNILKCSDYIYQAMYVLMKEGCE